MYTCDGCLKKFHPPVTLDTSRSVYCQDCRVHDRHAAREVGRQDYTTGEPKGASIGRVPAHLHPEYYQGSAAPADWDSPTPLPFVSANGAYLVALGGADAACVVAGLTILGLALAELGIGAKTSSGYGRMTLTEPPAIKSSTASVSPRSMAATNCSWLKYWRPIAVRCLRASSAVIDGSAALAGFAVAGCGLDFCGAARAFGLA